MTSLSITLLVVSAICAVLALVGFLFPNAVHQKSRAASVVGFGGLAGILFGVMFLVAPNKSNQAEVSLQLPSPQAAVSIETDSQS